MFSFLPAEVRIQIWRHISPQLHVGRSLPRKPKKLSRDQEILLTCRRIYAEVATEEPSGYNDDKILTCVRPDYRYKSCIAAKNTKEVLWDLEDAISRGFCGLPWHDLKVRIWIWAPDRKDSGQILCLHKKVRALVEILKTVKGFLSLWMIFDHREDTSGFDDADQPQCSIKNKTDLLQMEGEISGANWDYELIFSLFLQQRNVKMAEIYCTEMAEGKRENRMMSQNFLKAERIMRQTTPYGSPEDKPIENHLDLIFMVVERMLDLMLSKTADMLRLDHFSSWYTDKLHGTRRTRTNSRGCYSMMYEDTI